MGLLRQVRRAAQEGEWLSPSTLVGLHTSDVQHTVFHCLYVVVHCLH